MNNLLKEAIADAKAVKETAIANAKAALEESFAPHLKELLAAKLQAMDEEDESMKAKEAEMMDEFVANEGKEEIEEEFDLNEILMELEEGVNKLFPIDFSGVYAGMAADAIGEAYCTTDACEVKLIANNQ